jgi:maltose O-acetyltransferase
MMDLTHKLRRQRAKYALRGVTHGYGCDIDPTVMFGPPGRITLADHVKMFRRTEVVATDGHVSIGERTFVNHDCIIRTEVTIGKRCAIAARCIIHSGSHPLGGPEQRCGDESTSDPIVIGDGVWLGTATLVLPGVTIGDGVVVGAGSVVTRDLEPNAIYVGNPARKLRSLDSAEPGPA